MVAFVQAREMEGKMPREIKLPNDTRILATDPGSRLGWETGAYLSAGTALVAGDVCELFYDHRTQKAVPILWDWPENSYLLLDEVGLIELMQ